MSKVVIHADTDCFACRYDEYLCTIGKDSNTKVDLPKGRHLVTFFSSYFGTGVTSEVELDISDESPLELEVEMRKNEEALERALCDEIPEEDLIHLKSGYYTHDGFILVRGIEKPGRVIKIDDRCGIIHNRAFLVDGLDTRQIFLPENLKAIGSLAFNDFLLVKELFLPESVRTIRRRAFHAWMGIEEIDLSNQIRVIPDRAFEVSTIKKMDFPSSVLFVNERAFYLCRDLEWVRFEGRPIRIAEDAFDGCEALSSIWVPKGDVPYFRSILPSELHPAVKEVGSH